MLETRKELADRVRVTVTKEKVIKMTVEATDAASGGGDRELLCWPTSTG